MGKLHELIAVEKNVRGTAEKITDETGNTFSDKHQLFCTQQKRWTPLNADDVERLEEELAKPFTTVGNKLNYFSGAIIKVMDVIIQKEKTNAEATADIMVEDANGKPLILSPEVPVSALVQIENVLEDLRKKVFDKIPTLDPSKIWIEDTQAGEGKYRTDAIKRQSTKKINKPITMHPGTDRHPPQVVMATEDVVSGTWDLVYFSGMLSPADKSVILGRLDILIEAVKKARSRANDIDIVRANIGKKLFDFVFSGTI